MKLLAVPLALAGAYAVFLAVTVLTQRRMIYFPPRDYPVTPARLGPGWSEATLTAEDGVTLAAWRLAPLRRGDPVLLYLHGNAVNLAGLTGLAREFRAAGFAFRAVEYRGYGASAGRPSEQGLARDARAAYRWLLADGVPPARLFIYGQSLGAAVAARLAAEADAAGLIMESSFPSILAMARLHYPYLLVPEAVIFDKFRTVDHAARARCPVLVLHAEDDSIAPLPLGRAVFEAAPQPKIFVAVRGADHNSISPSLPAVRAALDAFRAACLKRGV